MKLAAVIKAITPFLATDKKPDEVLAAVIAADKKAKDAAGSGLGARELEEKDQAAKDRKAAHDKARDKMTAEDKKAFDAMSDEEKDKVAKDRDDDPEHTNDEEIDAEDEDYTEGADPTTPGGNRAKGKTAIDSAEVDRRIARAVANRDALHTALREVEPIVGRIAADSAGAAYKAALDKLGVDTKGISPSAFPAMLKLAKDKAQATPASPAMDSAGVAALDKVIPGYGRLR
jgi:hypothetical protein